MKGFTTERLPPIDTKFKCLDGTNGYSVRRQLGVTVPTFHRWCSRDQRALHSQRPAAMLEVFNRPSRAPFRRLATYITKTGKPLGSGKRTSLIRNQIQHMHPPRLMLFDRPTHLSVRAFEPSAPVAYIRDLYETPVLA